MQITSIILAGGKGTRMQSANRHKVCFEIDGRPAINRAIENYKIAGVQHHIIVVGALAGQVIETVGREHPGVAFAYQAEQRGTGHAARQGAQILADLRYEGAVLIAVGDRLIDPQVVEQLIAEFRASNSDLAFLTGQRNRARQGSVLRGADGTVLGVVEHIDLASKAALARIRGLAQAGAPDLDAQARKLVQAVASPAKAARTFGDLWERLSQKRLLSAAEALALIPEERTLIRLGDVPDQILRPQEASQASETNLSVYLIKAPVLYAALAQLQADNAQGEEYLPDIINILARARDNGRPRYRIRTVSVDDPTLALGFNNPAELLEIQNLFRARRTAPAASKLALGKRYRPVREWQRVFSGTKLEPQDEEGAALSRQMRQIYGDHPALIAERAAAYESLLAQTAAVLGEDAAVLLARAPGRINMVGRHIDHQGGSCNLLAIDREILVAAALREDDQVRLFNVRPDEFGQRSFSLDDLLEQLSWDDWLELVNSDAVHQMVLQEAGDWAQYVRAAFLRLQKHYSDVKLRGMDLVFHGAIPVAAGLSSSSALVVSTAEAIVALHGLDVRPRQFVDLCGEGEWFVGTRGGSADHAAMKFARRDSVINVQFLPFVVESATTFPPGYRLVFCNSHIQAKKAAASREIFNQRVACYHLGVRLIRRLYPRYAPLISYLRDINPRALPLRLADIYRMLIKLPEQASRAELDDLLPPEVVSSLLGPARDPDTRYPIRGVVLFGLAETERGRVCPSYLAQGDMAGLGRLMRISHDGDRVVSHDRGWQARPFSGPSGNAYLLDLMDDLASGEPERVLAAQLHLQPGGYGCSTREIDLMVDIALRTEGVLGAQLAGAGLGGGMMVLVREDNLADLTRNMTARYYAPRNLPPAILPTIPIAGSGVLAFSLRP